MKKRHSRVEKWHDRGGNGHKGKSAVAISTLPYSISSFSSLFTLPGGLLKLLSARGRVLHLHLLGSLKEYTNVHISQRRTLRSALAHKHVWYKGNNERNISKDDIFCLYCKEGKKQNIRENPQYWMPWDAYLDLRVCKDPELIQKDRPDFLRKVLEKRKELEADLKQK